MCICSCTKGITARCSGPSNSSPLFSSPAFSGPAFSGLAIWSVIGGKWPIKWKFLKLSFRIPRQDTEIRFVTKFDENRLAKLPKGRMVYHTKKLALRETHLSPHFAKNGPIAPKITWTLSPLTCPCIPNLVRIGCVLPDLFRKAWFFGPKSQYNNISFQLTINEHTERT